MKIVEVADNIRKGSTITNAEWSFLHSVLKNWMKNFFKQTTQDSSNVTDRVILFVRYAQEYHTWSKQRKPSLKKLNFEQYLGLFRLKYNMIETFFILKKLGVSYHYKLVWDILHSRELQKMAEVLTVYYKYKPQTDMEWVVRWVEYRSKKNLMLKFPKRVGYTAQQNYLAEVKKFQTLLNAVREYEHNERKSA